MNKKLFAECMTKSAGTTVGILGAVGACWAVGEIATGAFEMTKILFSRKKKKKKPESTKTSTKKRAA